MTKLSATISSFRSYLERNKIIFFVIFGSIASLGIIYNIYHANIKENPNKEATQTKQEIFHNQPPKSAVKTVNIKDSHYTLNGDISVHQPYTRIEGIHVKGDVNFIDSDGARSTNLLITEDNDKNKGGNLNIENSNMQNVNENIIQRNVNIKDSSIDNFNKNKIGEFEQKNTN